MFFKDANFSFKEKDFSVLGQTAGFKRATIIM